MDQKVEKEDGGDFPEIPDWQTEAADVQAGLRSVAKEGIQNVWDRPTEHFTNCALKLPNIVHFNCCKM